MKVLRSLILAVAVSGCGAPSHATPTTPVAADAREVLERFTQVIWPAINDYNRSPGQGSYPKINPAYSQFWAIRDKGLSTDERKQVDAAAGDLAGVNGDHPDAVRLSDLAPAQTQITALNPPNATLHVCYTYTVDEKHPRPAASEVTVELHKADDWYLEAISDDHVVPSCAASSD